VGPPLLLLALLLLLLLLPPHPKTRSTTSTPTGTRRRTRSRSDGGGGGKGRELYMALLEGFLHPLDPLARGGGHTAPGGGQCLNKCNSPVHVAFMGRGQSKKQPVCQHLQGRIDVSHKEVGHSLNRTPVWA